MKKIHDNEKNNKMNTYSENKNSLEFSSNIMTSSKNYLKLHPSKVKNNF